MAICRSQTRAGRRASQYAPSPSIYIVSKVIKSSAKRIKTQKQMTVKRETRKDPFDVLDEDVVALIIRELPRVAMEMLRRVSTLWKQTSEYHNGNMAPKTPISSNPEFRAIPSRSSPRAITEPEDSPLRSTAPFRSLSPVCASRQRRLTYRRPAPM